MVLWTVTPTKSPTTKQPSIRLEKKIKTSDLWWKQRKIKRIKTLVRIISVQTTWRNVALPVEERNETGLMIIDKWHVLCERIAWSWRPCFIRGAKRNHLFIVKCARPWSKNFVLVCVGHKSSPALSSLVRERTNEETPTEIAMNHLCYRCFQQWRFFVYLNQGQRKC